MEGTLALAGAAVLLVLLHVVVAAYLYRTVSTEQKASASEYAPDPDRERAASTDAGDRVSCPACGMPNDPSYRFCRRCIADLSSGVSASAGADRRKQLGS